VINGKTLYVGPNNYSGKDNAIWLNGFIGLGIDIGK